MVVLKSCHILSATTFLYLMVAKSVLSSAFVPSTSITNTRYTSCVRAVEDDAPSSGGWTGDVVSNDASGKIRGCKIQSAVGVNIADDIITEWTIQIDGVEADLGQFSAAIYKKLLQDVKQQRFQGFRPGTIPPHLQVTYKAFCMDECARETILEAMQQNNIRPFEDARRDVIIETISVPPPSQTKGGSSKKKKKGGRKAKGAVADSAVADTEGGDNDNDAKEEAEPWKTYTSMKDAIEQGKWVPGTSFSFTASNLRGQQVKNDSETESASPLGLNFR